MPVAKLTASGTPNVMKTEERNDSVDTIIRQAIGKEPLLSFPRAGDNPVQWIQLLQALDQQGVIIILALEDSFPKAFWQYHEFSLYWVKECASHVVICRWPALNYKVKNKTKKSAFSNLKSLDYCCLCAGLFKSNS